MERENCSAKKIRNHEELAELLKVTTQKLFFKDDK